MSDLETQIKAKIRSIPDYPKKGVLFRDITPVLKDFKMFGACVEELADRFADSDIDYVAGIEARGFIIGAAVANRLKVGFIPLRKKGKLPYKRISVDYDLEYGRETLEMHEDALERDKRVLIIDDLLATGGTARAADELVEKAGATVAGFGFLVELEDLKGREALNGARIVSLVKC